MFYHLSVASIYHLLSSFTCVCCVLNNSLKTKSVAIVDGSGEPTHSWDQGEEEIVVKDPRKTQDGPRGKHTVVHRIAPQITC